MQQYETINEYKNWSLESEQSVIGALLMDNQLLPEVLDLINHADFYRQDHCNIFAAIEELHINRMPVDVTTLVNLLESSNKLESSGGLSYLAEMAHNTPSSSNVLAYCHLLKEKSKERILLSTAKEMAECITDGTGNSDKRINDASSIFNKLDFDDVKQKTLNELIDEVSEDIARREESSENIHGLSTGFDDFDKRTNGLSDSDLIVVAGRPAMGKTTFAMNVVQNTLDKGDGVTVVFSLEMSSKQLVTRMIAAGGPLRLQGIRDGDIQDAEWPYFSSSITGLRDKPLIIDDRPSLTPQQLRARCLREQRKHGSIKLVVIDYLQLMTTVRTFNREAEVSEISRSLKALAKELDCPVIALSQLNRSGESKDNKRPILSNLRDSGAIEQDADIVCFLYRDEVYNEHSSFAGIAELITAKFRNGKIGTDYLTDNLQASRFDNFHGDLPFVENTPTQSRQGVKMFGDKYSN